MADTPWLREDTPNPDIEILRRLKFWVDLIPGPPQPYDHDPHREPDPRAPFRARLDGAMYCRGCSLEGVVKVIVDALANGNPDSRQAAAGLLGCVANAIAETSAPVTSIILDALTALIEALKKEENCCTCEAEIDAIIHFAPHDGVRVVRALVGLAMEAGTDPKLRQRALMTLRKCAAEVAEVVALVWGELLSLLEDKEALVRRETCMTLGALGKDGVAIIPALEKVVVEDNEPSVQREAARALAALCADAKSTTAFEDLKDSATQMRVLSVFAGIGKDGESLRKNLVARWVTQPTDRIPASPAEMIETTAEAQFTPPVISTQQDGSDSDAEISRNIFRKVGVSWNIRYAGGALFAVPDAVGLHYIAYLLNHHGQPVPVLKLRGEYSATQLDATSRTVSGAKQASASAISLATDDADEQRGSRSSRQRHRPPRDDVGIMPDGEALKAFHDRLKKIPEELEKARKIGNESQIEKLERERTFILKAIRAAQGPGKHGRISVELKRVRDAVRKAISESIEKISLADPILGTHLKHCIRSGDLFSYEPERPFFWDA